MEITKILKSLFKYAKKYATIYFDLKILNFIFVAYF